MPKFIQYQARSIICISEPPIKSYIPAGSFLACPKIEKDAKGKTSNEKCAIKNNIIMMK